MTNWLVNHFVEHPDQVDKPSTRTAYGILAGSVGIVVNSLLCITKLIIGLIAGSISIIADSVNNLSDASSSIVSLLGFKLAARPADQEHPYGHGRYEYLASLAVAVMIVVVGFNLVRSSIDRIIHPELPEFSFVTLGILLFSVLVKVRMVFFNRTIGKKIQSDTLLATAVDARNDIITTSFVIVTALITKFWGVNLDPWAGLAVGAFIIWSGWELIKEAVSPLLGKAPEPERVQYFHDKILSYDGILGTHDLLVHDYGPGRQFASAHVEMAGEHDAFHNHEILDAIERDFFASEGIILTLHYDPIVTVDPKGDDLRNWLCSKLKDIDPSLSVHDVTFLNEDGTLARSKNAPHISLDCSCPQQITLSDVELSERLKELVHSRYPEAHCSITIDHNFIPLKQFGE